MQESGLWFHAFSAKKHGTDWQFGGCIVAQEGRFAPRIENHHVDVAIIVQIIEAGAATAPPDRQPVATLPRDIGVPIVAIGMAERDTRLLCHIMNLDRWFRR